jgi:hypothetical protein
MDFSLLIMICSKLSSSLLALDFLWLLSSGISFYSILRSLMLSKSLEVDGLPGGYSVRSLLSVRASNDSSLLLLD